MIGTGTVDARFFPSFVVDVAPLPNTRRVSDGVLFSLNQLR